MLKFNSKTYLTGAIWAILVLEQASCYTYLCWYYPYFPSNYTTEFVSCSAGCCDMYSTSAEGTCCQTYTATSTISYYYENTMYWITYMIFAFAVLFIICCCYVFVSFCSCKMNANTNSRRGLKTNFYAADIRRSQPYRKEIDPDKANVIQAYSVSELVEQQQKQRSPYYSNPPSYQSFVDISPPPPYQAISEQDENKA